MFTPIELSIVTLICVALLSVFVMLSPEPKRWLSILSFMCALLLVGWMLFAGFSSRHQSQPVADNDPRVMRV